VPGQGDTHRANNRPSRRTTSICISTCNIYPLDLPHTHYDVPTTDTYTQPRAHLHPLRTHHRTRWKHAREPHTPIRPRWRTSAMGQQIRRPANTR
jgi:hypothetical protein